MIIHDSKLILKQFFLEKFYKLAIEFHTKVILSAHYNFLIEIMIL